MEMTIHCISSHLFLSIISGDCFGDEILCLFPFALVYFGLFFPSIPVVGSVREHVGHIYLL